MCAQQMSNVTRRPSAPRIMPSRAEAAGGSCYAAAARGGDQAWQRRRVNMAAFVKRQPGAVVVRIAHVKMRASCAHQSAILSSASINARDQHHMPAGVNVARR